MSDTPRHALPLLEAAQAQKHVTHNEALIQLDALASLYVLDRDLAAPPGSPSDGDTYLVAASATGDWAGEDGKIAYLVDGAWRFYPPFSGARAYIDDENLLLIYDSGAWVDIATMLSFQNVALLGVNTTADATNKLAVKSNAALFDALRVADSGDGDMQVKLSKEATGDTASWLLQTNYSGRAEMGLTGDDDLHIKVSPNGSTWYDAIVAERNTGRVSFPSGGVREMLAANRNYYVDETLGDDANDGLSSGAGAFETVQKAIDVVAGLDRGIYDTYINLADDTYSSTIYLKAGPGSGLIWLKGNTTTPSNVLFSTTSGSAAIWAQDAGNWLLKDFKVTTTSGSGVLCAGAGTRIGVGNLEFGDCSSHHLSVGDGAFLSKSSDYEISGDAICHISAADNAIVSYSGGTITLTGTPDFSTAFVQASSAASMGLTNSITFSGSGTGKRYKVFRNAIINSGGGGETYLPGDVAGIELTGGLYE